MTRRFEECWQTPGDRRTGLTAWQTASAASWNVTRSGISVEQFVDLVIESAIALIRGLPSPLAAQRKAIARTIRRQHFQYAPWHPSRLVPTGVGHFDYVTHLLHPNTNDPTESFVGAELLGCGIDAHARMLDGLRARSEKGGDQVYRNVMTGRCRGVLRACRNGELPGHDWTTLSNVVRLYARCLVIRCGHARIEDIRLFSIAPLGNRFAGFSTWKTVGHTFLATIAAPATLLMRFPDIARDARFLHMTADEICQALVDETLLPAAEAATIFRIVGQVLARLEARGIVLIDAAPILEAIRAVCETLSRVRAGNMKAAGWSRIGFNDLRIGLSASEGSAFVALQVLRSFGQIDERIDMIANPGKRPDRRDDWLPSERALGKASVIMRTEGLPDCAAMSHDASLNGHHIDLDRGSGRTGVASMLQKISDPEVRRRADKALGVDGRVWFRY